MRSIILLLSLCFVLVGCKQDQSASITEMNSNQTNMNNDTPEWAKGATIYEVNIRQYTDEGTFNAFSEHIPRLKDMGVEILWLMPVFPISETKRKGTLGSYYAVSDFRAVNPKFGTKQDLLNLIEKIHAYKMKVILDWVPNHTGWDHTWITTHPDFYTKGPDGKITDPIDPNTGKSHGWSDVADLNYDNQEMRDSMTADLVYWLKEHNIDGYRMDIAFGVPLDYWKKAIDTLRTIKPDIFMLAESEDPAHVNEAGFNSCYSWSLHHLMNDIANERKSVQDYMMWRDSQQSQFVKGNMMTFITNHDENSWNGSEKERMGSTAYQSFAILSHTMDGIPLIYSGQEEPLVKRLEFFEKDNIGFKDFKTNQFYKDLIHLKKNNSALWNRPYGAPMEFIGEGNDVLAYKREKDGNVVYVILNLSGQDRKFKLSENIIGADDIFRHEPVNISAGSEQMLRPWEFIVASIHAPHQHQQ